MNLRLSNVVAVLGLALGALPAWAQEAAPQRPERPYLGLFGGGVGETDELLTLNGSVGGGHDGDVLAEQVGGAASLGSFGGSYGQLDARLAYALQRTRVGIDASLATSSRYVPVLRPKVVGSHSGSIGASLQLSERTRLTGSQTVTYQPFYSMSLFPALFEPGLADTRAPDHDLGITRQNYVSYASDLGFTHALSARASVAMIYGYQRSDFGSSDRNFSSQRAGARFTRGLTSRLRVNVGYDYHQGEYGVGAETRQALDHSLGAGIDYTRRLTAFSRTTVSVTTGSSATSELGRTYYRFTGSASVSREFGRTWSVSLAYDRGSRYLETFDAPLFQDALSCGVAGLINRRIQFRSTVGISTGEVGLTAGDGLNTYYGTTGLIVGLTRFVGLGFDYSYFRYSFENATFLPVGFSPALHRQRVGTSLTLWAPLIHRERKADASR